MTTPTPPNEAKPLRCTHCGKEWSYGGGMKVNASCPDCGLHTKIKDSLMMIVLIASLAILGGLGTVFAEEITLETSFPIYEYSCLEGSTEHYPYTDCYIQGKNFFISNVDGISYSWDVVEEKYVPTEQLIAEAKQLYQDSIIEKAPELTRTEKAIIRYGSGDVSILEEQIISLLEKTRAVCYVDVLTIQTYGELEVPIEQFIDPLTGELSVQMVRNFISQSFDQKNHPLISKLLQDLEACRGQIALEYVTGPRYLSMVVDDENSYHFKHQDSAIGMETFTLPKLTEQAFQITQDAAKDVICKSNIYRENYKQDYGCFPELTYSDNNMIEYQSAVMDAYERYLDNGDSEQSIKVKQKVVRETLRSLHD